MKLKIGAILISFSFILLIVLLSWTSILIAGEKPFDLEFGGAYIILLIIYLSCLIPGVVFCKNTFEMKKSHIMTLFLIISPGIIFFLYNIEESLSSLKQRREKINTEYKAKIKQKEMKEFCKNIKKDIDTYHPIYQFEKESEIKLNDLSDIFDTFSDNTDLQKEEKLNQLLNKIVVWEIPVTDVELINENKFKIDSTNLKWGFSVVTYIETRNPDEIKKIKSTKIGDVIKIKGKIYDKTRLFDASIIYIEAKIFNEKYYQKNELYLSLIEEYNNKCKYLNK